MTNDEAQTLALDDAEAAIELARTSYDPVCWITGNRFMPPLRGFGHAETVWHATVPREAQGVEPFTLWDTYQETFERALEEASVHLAAPDYDNALYVVDLNRWEYDEDAEGDSLNDEWVSAS